jgi:mono/diheme cytochrome c family protein
MKNIETIFFSLISILIVISITSYKKDNLNPNALYTPTSSDVSPTATLQDLQSGRTLYVNNCGQCHNYYMPEDYSSTQWATILSSMAPRTGMTSAQVQLVKKYVSKGK